MRASHSLPRLGLVLLNILLVGCTGSAPDVPPSLPRSSLPSTSARLSIRSRAVSSSQRGRDLFPSPLPQGRERITKKPFGIFVSPGHSPVIPERFTGYHTGVDFETFPLEQNRDVPVSAVCAGMTLFTGWVKGYGGVFIQSCTVEGSPITVLYGHLNSASFTLRKGEAVPVGRTIGLLGKGFSTETDGERKHLHLAVHRGSSIEFRGYVPSPGELKQWIDPYAASE